jgi:polyisoprenoid-binding protein YceI
MTAAFAVSAMTTPIRHVISSMPGAFACRILLVVAFGVACVPAAARPAISCPIDEGVGEIGFSVGYFGLFHSSGRFRHFSGNLWFAPAHPERTSMSVDIDAQSVEMSWDEGAATLRSAAYFDVLRYRTIRFRSTGITPIGPGRYQVTGSLEIRGVTHAQVLDAVLARNATGADAEYVITGRLSRFSFRHDGRSRPGLGYRGAQHRGADRAGSGQPAGGAIARRNA